MQRTSLWIAFILVSLCFANFYAVSAEDSETDECWVIVKENYEWIHEDEEMVAMHSRESNLSYDSQCRLIERTDTTSDMLEHKFIFYNEDSTISNSSLYWYGSDGDIIYLWEETFGYQGGVLTARTWAEFFYDDGNFSLNQEQHTLYSYDSQGREILSNTSYGERFYTVETTYDESGNIIKVDSLTDGELDNSIEISFNNNFDKILLKSDKEQISRVFLNLIKNSIESINQKAQNNNNFSKKITIELTQDDSHIRSTIEDNGIGFNELKDNIKNILNPYFTTKKNGTGLGLSIVNKIINDHNGKIDFIPIKNGAKINITFLKQ